MSNNKNYPLNILIVESGYGFGGSHTFLKGFLNHIDKEKFHATVLFYYSAPDVSHRLEEAPVINLGIDLQRRADLSNTLSDKTPSRWDKLKRYFVALYELVTVDLPACLSILKILRHRKVEIVMLNNDVHYHIPAVLASVFSGTPCVCRKAGVGGGRKIKRLLGRFIHTYIAISDAAAQEISALGIGGPRLATIFPGVELQKFVCTSEIDAIRSELDIPTANKLIASFSRIELGKGQYELIMAASLILREFPLVTFLVVGDDIDDKGKYRAELEKLVRGLSLTRQIKFLGWRENIPQLLAGIDIFVHCPSTVIEGLSIATLEAMASGKPTVVTSSGGLKETTVDGETGYVVQGNDVEALAKALLNLLTNKELAQKMGANARKRAESYFDIEKNVKKMEEILESIGDV